MIIICIPLYSFNSLLSIQFSISNQLITNIYINNIKIDNFALNDI